MQAREDPGERPREREGEGEGERERERAAETGPETETETERRRERERARERERESSESGVAREGGGACAAMQSGEKRWALRSALTSPGLNLSRVRKRYHFRHPKLH